MLRRYFTYIINSLYHNIEPSGPPRDIHNEIQFIIAKALMP